MQDVFISYSSMNSEVAEEVCEALEKKGLRCWIAPRNIKAGKEWGEEIIKGIEGSKIFLLIFSKHSNESIQVLREVERAVSKRLDIVNFRIENVVPTKSMEYFLYTNHWVEAYEGEVDEYLDELGEVLKELVTEYKEDIKTEEYIGIHNTHNSKRKKRVRNKYINYVLIALGVIVIIVGLLNVKAMKENIQVLNSEQSQALSTEKNQSVVVEENEVQNVSGEQGGTVQQTVTENSEEINDINTGQEETQELETDGNRDVSSGGTTNPQQQENKNNQQGEQKQETVKLALGDYVEFGSYNGEVIQWVVVHVKEDGTTLLLTKDVIALKSFDAAESGTYNLAVDGTKFDGKKVRDGLVYTENQIREMKGSNHWADSNLRSWLNSSDRKVSYKGTAPSDKAIADKMVSGGNDYDTEEGFLYGFTDAERSMLKTTTYKSVLASADASKKEGGSETYNFNKGEIATSLGNYKSAYYEMLTDKVFLLSVEEVIYYLQQEYLPIEAKVSTSAQENDQSGWYKDLKPQTDGSYRWWLRTPDGKDGAKVCSVGDKGDTIYSDYAVGTGGGVRPAVAISLEGVSVQGSGKEEDPYSLK